jgi:hypothetical protein
MQGRIGGIERKLELQVLLESSNYRGHSWLFSFPNMGGITVSDGTLPAITHSSHFRVEGSEKY